MAVYVDDHPLIKHKLGLMRQKDISTKDFRDLASEVARLLTYEATQDLETEQKVIEGWAGEVEVEKIKGKKITIVPMGHEGVKPTLEDNVCAKYIDSLINGKNLSLDNFIPAIKKSSGKYFFSNDQRQYPQEDFKRCLKIKRFNFIIYAISQKDYAILKRCDISPSKI